MKKYIPVGLKILHQPKYAVIFLRQFKKNQNLEQKILHVKLSGLTK